MRPFVRAIAIASLMLVSAPVHASDDETPSNPWGNSPYHDWMKRQTVNPEAQQKLAIPYSSCCDHADRVKTEFRVDKDTRGDTWWYLDPSDGQWKRIPNEIVHEEADATMPPQLRTEGVLFVYDGKPTCFWAPEGGL